MEKVCVLLSTYNGRKFIKEQLETIYNQTYPGFITIPIRDDGSTDDTVSIIKEFPQTENRKIIMTKGMNIGPQKSFLELIRKSEEADYYFFSDQDDIWYADKIEKAVTAMRGKTSPICYCTNYDVYNSILDVKRNAVIQRKPDFTPIKIILYNQIPGCVIGFNKSMMSVLKEIKLDNLMMHDSMVLSLAASVGEILYDHEPGISHRIHGENAVGEGHRKIIPHKWMAEKIKLVIEKDDYDISRMADEFLKTGRVKEKYVADLKLIRDYKKSIQNTFRLLRHPDTHDVWYDRTTLSIRFRILLHVF